MSNKIIKKGFFDTKDVPQKELIIAENKEVFLFDRGDFLEKVTLEQGAVLHYFGYFSDIKKYQKYFHFVGENAKVFSKNLILASGIETEVIIHGNANHNNTTINTDIISFATKSGVVNIDGIFQIPAGISKASGYLDEENVFLGTGSKIRGIPTLLVESNDISASHACKMHKISDEKLFYLRSRGISREDATAMMIESYIERIFGNIAEHDNVLFEKLKEEIIGKI